MAEVLLLEATQSSRTKAKTRHLKELSYRRQSQLVIYLYALHPELVTRVTCSCRKEIELMDRIWS